MKAIRSGERRDAASDGVSGDNDVTEQAVYTTLGEYASERFEEKRSVFIGHAAHSADEDEARAFITARRKEYSDASHNCYAYMIANGNIARYSDDGEPQGTAGLPILNVLKASGAADAVIVVTRYFGGTLLGTGGLCRAYTRAAKLAVDAAGVISYESYSELTASLSYSDYDKVSSLLPKFAAKLDDAVFGVGVELYIAVRDACADAFINRISEITAGRARVVCRGKRLDR